MPKHGKQIEWINQHLINQAQLNQPKVDKEELALAYHFLKSAKNLLSTLNKLDNYRIPQFINTFLRPFDESEPYKLLAEKFKANNATDIELICYALVTYNTPELVIDEIKAAAKRIDSQLSEHLKTSIYGSLRFLRHMERRSTKKPSITKNSFINISMIDRPLFSLRGATLFNMMADYSYFDKADLTDIVLLGASARHAYFNRSMLTGASLANANLCGSGFDSATLVNADFDRTLLDGTSFNNADMKNSQLNYVHMRGTIFTGANLTAASLHDAYSEYANFDHTKLVKANMRNSTMYSSHFDHANMTCAYLDDASFEKSTFKEADLTNATLINTSFLNANLEGANFTNTVLTNTCFDGASLNGAIFVHADLKEAYLDNATLDGARFFEPEHLLDPKNKLRSELDWWQEQIFDFEKDPRRELRKHILNDLISHTKELPQDAKKAVYDVAFYHPIFQHRKKSLRGCVNRLFTQLEPDQSGATIVAKTPNQKVLEKALLPQNSSQTRKHLHVTRSGGITIS